MVAFIAVDTYMRHPRNIFGLKKKNAKPVEEIGFVAIGSIIKDIPEIDVVITVKGSGYKVDNLPPTTYLIEDVSRKEIYDVIHEQLAKKRVCEIASDTLDYLGDEDIKGKSLSYITRFIAPYMVDMPTGELLSAAESGTFGLYITPNSKDDTLTLVEKAQIFMSAVHLEEVLRSNALFRVAGMMFLYTYARKLSKCNSAQEREIVLRDMSIAADLLEEDWQYIFTSI